jgi:hypothetical protein
MDRELVRIIKPYGWYKEHIAGLFKVVSENDTYVTVRSMYNSNIIHRSIRKKDVEFVSFDSVPFLINKDTI